MADTGQSGNTTKSPTGDARGDGTARTRRGAHLALPRLQDAGHEAALDCGEGNGPGPAWAPRQGCDHHAGCLPTYLMREAALGTVANSVALYGVEVADVEGHTLALADNVAAKAARGPTRCSRAKEVLWGLLTRGFYVLPPWHMQYQRLLCLAW